MRGLSINSDNSQARTFDVFFYGLFMDADLLKSKGVQPHDSRAAILHGFRVALGEKTMLLRDAASSAQGMLFRITHEDMTHLYRDQPDYCPEPVLAELATGERIAALTMVHLVPPIGSARQEPYASQYMALMRRLGFSIAHM